MDEQRTTISRNPLLKSRQSSSSEGAVLVEIEGNDLGKTFKIKHEQIYIGRGENCDLMILHQSVSRKHAVISEEIIGYSIEDLGSTNGVIVNDLAIKKVLLKDSDVIRIGDYSFKFLASENLETLYHQELYQLKNVDALTQCYNKRYFTRQFQYEYERMLRYRNQLGYAIIDLDHFKRVNDTYGHLAGDYILTNFAAIVREHIRKSDIFGRVGGEEFALIIPETSKKGIIVLAEKIRGIVEDYHFEYEGKSISITISMGVVSTDDFDPAVSINRFIDTADQFLYRAKGSGRNQVQYIL